MLIRTTDVPGTIPCYVMAWMAESPALFVAFTKENRRPFPFPCANSR